MSETNVPYLCGGIYFSLIIQAKKTRTKARDKLQGGSDGLKEPDVMKGLVEVVTGDSFISSEGKTFKKCTTEFKTCQKYGTTYIPFTEPSVVSSFNSSLKRKDPDLLCRMSEFINRFINEIRSEWLVKALVEVIQQDEDINSSETFAISQKQIVSKKELNNILEVELPVFLLSVLGFILNKRQDNSKGRPTFEAWHMQNGPQTQWKYRANIGTSNLNRINVKTKIEAIKTDKSDIFKTCDTEMGTPSKTATERISDKFLASGQAIADVLGKAIENLADEMDKNSPTIQNESEASEQPKDESNTTIIQHQTNVVQNGDNNINLTNNGTINIKF